MEAPMRRITSPLAIKPSHTIHHHHHHHHHHRDNGNGDGDKDDSDESQKKEYDVIICLCMFTKNLHLNTCVVCIQTYSVI